MPFSLGLHPYFAVADLTAVRLSGLPAQAVDQTVNATAATATLLHVPAGESMELACRYRVEAL